MVEIMLKGCYVKKAECPNGVILEKEVDWGLIYAEIRKGRTIGRMFVTALALAGLQMICICSDIPCRPGC